MIALLMDQCLHASINAALHGFWAFAGRGLMSNVLILALAQASNAAHALAAICRIIKWSIPPRVQPQN